MCHNIAEWALSSFLLLLLCIRAVRTIPMEKIDKLVVNIKSFVELNVVRYRSFQHVGRI